MNFRSLVFFIVMSTAGLAVPIWANADNASVQPEIAQLQSSTQPSTPELPVPQSDQWEFSTQPIGDLFGVFGIETDFGVAENWSLGIAFDYFHSESATGNRSTRAVQYGLVGLWFPWHRRYTTGIFLRTEVDALTDNTERTSSFAHDANTIESFQFGYSWLLPKRVIVSWGFGIAYYQGDGGPGVDPSFLLQLGWSPL